MRGPNIKVGRYVSETSLFDIRIARHEGMGGRFFFPALLLADK